MSKKILLVLLSLLILIFTAGCGDEKVGLWEIYSNNTITLLELKEADGGYNVKGGKIYFGVANESLTTEERKKGIHKTFENDLALNFDEVFDKGPRQYIWNKKAPVKLERRYQLVDSFTESKDIHKVDKDFFVVKDGRLSAKGDSTMVFRKIDKDQLEKDINNLQEKFKSMIGQKTSAIFSDATAKSIKGFGIPAVFTRIIIIRDGKEAVIE
ncbi:MAG: hypothetical protein J6F33_05495 [Acidaminococcaceae bacterium]|nr:hypothetical protein [Acidaminococcaceae bacterium]